MSEKLERILTYVKEEFLRAIENFPVMRSPHEGYAIIFEEVDELWEEVKLQHNADGRDYRMLREATQIAAMAIRFIYDCCMKDEKK